MDSANTRLFESVLADEGESGGKRCANREGTVGRLVDANIVGVVIWDLDGRILDANDEFLRVVGYAREDLVSAGLSWKDLTPPEWLDRDARLWVPQLEMTGSAGPFEKEYFRKDGSRVSVLVGAAAFKQGADEGVAFVLDLTERKRATDAMREVQAELAHANRLATMGQLAASIAHEVNQPIGAVRNNAHAALRFLADDPPKLAEAREALECVVSETYRAGSIIGRIRDQIKKAPPRMESVDVNGAIEEVAALVRGELEKNRVALHLHLGAGLPPVYADRVQLQQVVLNLVLNGIDALVGADDEERALLIRTESTAPEGLLVAVCDSGPGIAPEDRERVFESFFTTKAGGVGIGLSICRSIIEAHGGRLWADADRARGAVLKFSLPAHH